MGLREIFFGPKDGGEMTGKKLADELVASKEQQQASREPARAEAAAEQEAKVTELRAAADQQYGSAEAPVQPESPEADQQQAA